MDKPIQLIVEELKKNITKIINDVQIPMMCITPIIKDVYEQCISIEKQQYEIVKKEYENSLATKAE